MHKPHSPIIFCTWDLYIVLEISLQFQVKHTHAIPVTKVAQHHTHCFQSYPPTALSIPLYEPTSFFLTTQALPLCRLELLGVSKISYILKLFSAFLPPLYSKWNLFLQLWVFTANSRWFPTSFSLNIFASFEAWLEARQSSTSPCVSLQTSESLLTIHWRFSCPTHCHFLPEYSSHNFSVISKSLKRSLQ